MFEMIDETPLVEFLITPPRRLGHPSSPCARSGDSSPIQIEITISFSHKLCPYNKPKARSSRWDFDK